MQGIHYLANNVYMPTKEMENNQMEKPLIYERISNIMSDLKAIGRDQKNTIQRFNFRGIDDVYNGLKPLLSKYQVFTTSEILSESSEERKTKSGGVLIYRMIKMRYTFWTVDGSSVWSEVLGESMDSGDKAANKAMSVAHKYALTQIFSIATENTDDPDLHSHEVAAKPIDAMAEKFDKNDSNSRSKMNKYMMTQGIPTELLDELAGKFHDMPKNEVLKQIAVIAKELK